MTPGERLREWRTAQGLSQWQLALKCEIPATTISNYERDELRPGRVNANKLQRASVDGAGVPALPATMWDEEPAATPDSAAS